MDVSVGNFYFNISKLFGIGVRLLYFVVVEVGIGPQNPILFEGLGFVSIKIM